MQKPCMDQYQLGRLGEDAVLEEYLALGYTRLGRRVRLRHGEIDLIMQDSYGTVVFVEVKTRRLPGFGSVEAVHAKKMMAMRNAAAEWLRSTEGFYEVRFDVVEAMYHEDGFEFEFIMGVEDAAC